MTNDDKYAEDAFERIKSMMADKEAVKLIEITLSSEDERTIYKNIFAALTKNIDIEPYTADIISTHILNSFVEFIQFKNAEAKQNFAAKASGNISPIFRRVDE